MFALDISYAQTPNEVDNSGFFCHLGNLALKSDINQSSIERSSFGSDLFMDIFFSQSVFELTQVQKDIFLRQKTNSHSI